LNENYFLRDVDVTLVMERKEEAINLIERMIQADPE